MKNAEMNRRAFLASGCAAVTGPLFAAAEPSPVSLGVPLLHEPLAFDPGALEPHFDSATLRLHHGQHHAEVFSKLQAIIKRLNVSVGSVASLMPNIRGMVITPDPYRTVVRMGGPPEKPSVADQRALRLYGGAHINHTAFWRFLAPPGSGPAGPEGKVAAAIAGEFGSIDDFKKAFTEAALNHFGSGWAFLVHRPDGRLVITTMKNEDNPLMTEFVRPEQQGRFILCLDLWEHAYYLKYRNDRKKYIEAWWKVVNWDFVSRAYAIVTYKPRAGGA